MSGSGSSSCGGGHRSLSWRVRSSSDVTTKVPPSRFGRIREAIRVGPSFSTNIETPSQSLSTPSRPRYDAQRSHSSFDHLPNPTPRSFDAPLNSSPSILDAGNASAQIVVRGESERGEQDGGDGASGDGGEEEEEESVDDGLQEGRLVRSGNEARRDR